jgi:hypothetical protein
MTAPPRLDVTKPFGRVVPPYPYPARKGERVGERFAYYEQEGKLFDARLFLIQSSTPLTLDAGEDADTATPQENMTTLQLSVSALINRAHRLPLNELKEAVEAILGEGAPETKHQIVAQLRLAVRRGKIPGGINKPRKSS